MVITIVVDHPLDVPLSPAHLLFFLAFPFPFEPVLHLKARAKVRGLALKGDFIDRLLLVISRFFVLFYRCSQIGKVAQRLVPALLGTVCSRLLPLLALLLSEACEGESALGPLLSFLLRHLLHKTPHRVVLKCLLVLPSQDTYQFLPYYHQYTMLLALLGKTLYSSNAVLPTGYPEGPTQLKNISRGIVNLFRGAKHIVEVEGRKRLGIMRCWERFAIYAACLIPVTSFQTWNRFCKVAR